MSTLMCRGHTHSRLACRVRRFHQAGLSLVELLVGVAIGMFVVASAAIVASTQLGDNRRMLAEIQLQQDLRASAEIISRQIRRAGSVAQPVNFVWTETAAGVDAGIIDDMAPTAAAATEVTFRYVRGPSGQLGFRFNGNRIQARLVLSPGAWQDLTDGTTMDILNFTVTPRHVFEPSQTAGEPTRMPCPKLCTGPDPTACWPRVRLREYTVSITGRSRADAAIVRTMNSVVRVRNDEIVLGGAAICPV